MHTKHPLPLSDLTLSVIRKLRSPVERIRAHDRDLADQLRRAATSVALNHSEAQGLLGGNRTQRLSTALGSAYEARRALKVAVAWGYLELDDELDDLLDHVAAALYRLRRR